MSIEHAGAPHGAGCGVQEPSGRGEAHQNDMHRGSSSLRAARWHTQTRAGPLTSLAHRPRRRSEPPRPRSFLSALHSRQPPGRPDRDEGRSRHRRSVVTPRCMSPGAASDLLEVTCRSIVPNLAQVPNTVPRCEWHPCAIVNATVVRRRRRSACPPVERWNVAPHLGGSLPCPVLSSFRRPSGGAPTGASGNVP